MINMMLFSDSDLKNIFNSIQEKIQSLDTSETIPEGHFDLGQITKDWRGATDDGIFENMAVCIFTGGIRVKVLETRWNGMREVFGNFKIDYVAKLEVDDILTNPKIIRHKGKILSLIDNANRIQAIQNVDGSFKNYLESRFKKGYEYLLKCIIKDFKYLKQATGRDFLKDIGMGGFKPDVHVARILMRIGLHDQGIDKLTELFQRISLACDLSLPEIDRLLFRYGSGHKMRYAICGTDPLCDICKVPKCSLANR